MYSMRFAHILRLIYMLYSTEHGSEMFAPHIIKRMATHRSSRNAASCEGRFGAYMRAADEDLQSRRAEPCRAAVLS